ncbi:hypothetical protein Tco_0509188 [Tanacetum coccineum]
MVGALMYLTTSRQDIVHAKCYCARYQARPTKKHLTAVKWIFWYLKYTINMGLWYPKETGFKLTAFLDLDHAGCLDSRKKTSGGIQFLGGDKLVSWSSKKQDCTLMSSAEAKIPMYYDLKVEKGIVELFFVRTEYQLANLFTKALPEDRFKYLVRRYGMRCLTPEELEREIIEDLRLAREINALCAHLTAIIDERENFADELDTLKGRSGLNNSEYLLDLMLEGQWVPILPLSLLFDSLIVAPELDANIVPALL